MAKGAYYQGLIYANRDVEPVDFGKISLGIAEVELAKRKKREDFLMEQQEKFGEFFATDQLNAGLANPDAIGDELQARILTDFNAINASVEAKQMTYTQARALTNGLKGQLSGLKQSYDKMADFVQTYTDTENKGYSMELAMQHLNNFMEGSEIQKEGDTYFIAKEDPEAGTIRQPLRDLPLLYEKRERVDLNQDVVKSIFDIDKKADKVFSGFTAYNKFLTNKELSKEQEAVVEALMNQYDDRDLMDIADQFGIATEISKNGFKLANKKKVVDEILPKVKDLVKESYKLREYQEDSESAMVAGMKLAFSKTREYGTNKNSKYRLVPHKNGNVVFNPNKDPKITRLQAIPVPEGTDAESIKSLFPASITEQTRAATSPSGAILTPSFLDEIKPLDISDVTIRDFHITSDGKYMLVNGTYRPRVEKVEKSKDGVVTNKEMTFGEIEHGTFAVPINSIYARDVAQAIGLDAGHETAIFGNRVILDRVSLQNNRMIDF